MKRTDLETGEHYAYNRGPSSYGVAREVELLSTVPHVRDRDTGQYRPVNEADTLTKRRAAGFLVRPTAEANPERKPFLAGARELTSTWADEVEARRVETERKAEQSAEVDRLRAEFAPTGNRLADALVAVGVPEDNQTVRMLRAGERYIEIRMGTRTLAALLGIDYTEATT